MFYTGPSSSQTAHSSQHPVHYCMFPFLLCGPQNIWSVHNLREVHFVKSIYRETAVCIEVCQINHSGHRLSCFDLLSDIFPHEVKEFNGLKVKNTVDILSPACLMYLTVLLQTNKNYHVLTIKG